ncbi:hypothetical protein SALBM135S_01434 [Streptomyces alboniger]
MSVAVRLIADTLDAHGVSDAVVVGHSFGGLTAVEYAREHPARTRAAVNLDGFWWDPGFPGAERVNEGLLAMAGSVAPAGYIERKVADAGRLDPRRPRGGRCPGRRPGTAGRYLADAAGTDGGAADLRRAPRHRGTRRHRVAGRDRASTAPGPGGPRLPPAPGMEWFSEFNTRFTRSVSAELATLARTRPTITVAAVEATHIMHMEAPEAVARLVTEYVRGLHG